MTRTIWVAMKLGLIALLVTASLGGVTATEPARQAIAVTMKSRAVAPGEVLRLAITGAAAADRVRVTGFGREFPTFRETPTAWQALIGLDLDVKPGAHVLSIEVGAGARTTHRLVVAAKRFATRTLTVDPAFVNPPPDVQARIQADADRLHLAYASSSPVRLWAGPFVRPVSAAANSAFGTRSVFNGERRNPHGGADFASPAGTPVRTPSAGRVLIARDLYFTGNTVLIDHGLGLFSLFAHLASIDIREGDAVVTGQFVGNVGATGRVTGPHLHWSVRLNDARVDPLSLLEAMSADSSRGRK